ncbi:MAG: amino acid ABC transporter permease [Cyanobacteriota bacterium]
MEINQKIPLWRDDRVWKVILQAIAVIIVIIAIAWLSVNFQTNLERLNIPFGFEFLSFRASFDIGETPIEYTASDTFARALFVGFLNSLRVTLAGLILTTLIGITVGIARLSDNWLVNRLALVYVEILRNTPLLLQLLFWYLAIFISAGKEGMRTFPASIYLSNAGLSLPWFKGTSATVIWLVILLGGIIGAIFLWRWRTKVRIEQGKAGYEWLFSLGAIAFSAILAILITQRPPFDLNLPQLIGENQISGGLRLSPEYAALVIGLSLYTAAFIAEIVRAGIQSVPKGQWEAAKSLGLTPNLTMRLVIFPQALRVIIPPLNNQYLNLWKNSSLAIAVGYPDIYSIASTTFSQTSKAVEVMLIISLTYLSVSLIISFTMNLFNKAIQLQER